MTLVLEVNKKIEDVLLSEIGNLDIEVLKMPVDLLDPSEVSFLGALRDPFQLDKPDIIDIP